VNSHRRFLLVKDGCPFLVRPAAGRETRVLVSAAIRPARRLPALIAINSGSRDRDAQDASIAGFRRTFFRGRRRSV
jgi:hypothetical protein